MKPAKQEGLIYPANMPLDLNQRRMPLQLKKKALIGFESVYRNPRWAIPDHKNALASMLGGTELEKKKRKSVLVVARSRDMSLLVQERTQTRFEAFREFFHRSLTCNPILV